MNNVSKMYRTMNNKSTTPAQLWIGPHQHLISQLIPYLQSILCTNNSCGACTICTQIHAQQHHAVLWLQPSAFYTLEDLQPLFNALSFALGNEQQFFFIIQKADFLTLTCANTLLKSIEEPPPGYHFILLAQRTEQLLPTIRSRCTTRHFYGALAPLQDHELFGAFTALRPPAAAPFLKIIESTKISERESIEILDALLAYWLGAARTALLNGSQPQQMSTFKRVAALSAATLKPPMPGSSKLFWRDLYLTLFS